MRLFNTFTLTLEEFFEGLGIPDYAILSHCWGSPREEASFRQLQDGTYRQDCSG
jgi:hypothetical protein